MTLRIGLDSWIIQDGNYGEFEHGRDYRFALEFAFDAVQAVVPTSDWSPGLRHRSGATYDAEGRVLFADEDCWVVDFGILAFQSMKPPDWVRVGTVVRGHLYLGIDPFSYTDDLRFKVSMPDLYYEWTLRGIELETTPWQRSADESGRPLQARADVAPTYRKVQSTNAWVDDNQHAHYVLECERRVAS